MGTWGVKSYENDDGSEIGAIWQQFIAGSEGAKGAEKISSFFERVFFRGKYPIISDGTTNYVIAIAQGFADANIEIPEKLRKAVEECLNLELSASYLKAWGRLEKKRKKFLSELAAEFKVSISFESPAHRTSKYSDEIAALNRWYENLEKICSVRESMSGELMAYIDSIKPHFGVNIELQTFGFEDESAEDDAAELGNLRYMYLIWLVLFDLKFKTSEIVAAVNKVRL